MKASSRSNHTFRPTWSLCAACSGSERGRMATISEHLRMLRDVQGVHGGFVIAASGSLVDRDLPEAFDEQVFSQVGPRIARLHEAFASGKREMDVCMLRYADNKLYLRKMTWGFVG